MQANEQGDLLRRARKRARMTQAHLAQAAEISEKTVRRAEAGQPVSDETFRSLCSVLGLGASLPSPEAAPGCPAAHIAANRPAPSHHPFRLRACLLCGCMFVPNGFQNYRCDGCKPQGRHYVTKEGVPIADYTGLSPRTLRENAATPRSRVREATPEFAQELAAYEGDVLTAPGGRAEISPSQQRWVAMLDNRLLVVSRSHAIHHDVASVRSFLRRRGIVWSLEYHVDLSVIRAIYGDAERRRSGMTALGDGLTVRG